LLVSNLGYDYIVKYLYVISGMISGVYVIILVLLMMFKIIQLKKQQKQSNKNV